MSNIGYQATEVMKNVLITLSYAPDFDRCKLLVHSANKRVSGIEAHYLVIDRRDQALFAPLAGGRVQLLFKEDLLPEWLFPPIWGRKWWLSLQTLPVRGWILQQVVKLAVAEAIDADAFVFADSEVYFVRPWNVNTLWEEDRLRLFRTRRSGELLTSWRYGNWYRTAAQFAGVSNQELIMGAYIAQLASWRREHVLGLLRTIEQVTNKPWKRALLSRQDLSEFICYGAYIDHRLNGEGHFSDDRELTLSSWHFPIKSVEDIPGFLQTIQAYHVGVHIQSNLHLAAQDYAGVLAKFEEGFHI